MGFFKKVPKKEKNVINELLKHGIISRDEAKKLDELTDDLEKEIRAGLDRLRILKKQKKHKKLADEKKKISRIISNFYESRKRLKKIRFVPELDDFLDKTLEKKKF